MAAALGEHREAAVVREITKTYEETLRGTIGELARRFAEAPALGEITIVVAGAREGRDSAESSASAVTIEMLQAEGVSLKQASAIIAKLTGQSRREIYQHAIKNRNTEDKR